jgi:hypothetical protein
MDEKMRPVKVWVGDRVRHDPDARIEEIVATAIKHFHLQEDEALALCKLAGVQYFEVRAYT